MAKTNLKKTDIIWIQKAAEIEAWEQKNAKIYKDNVATRDKYIRHQQLAQKELDKIDKKPWYNLKSKIWDRMIVKNALRRYRRHEDDFNRRLEPYEQKHRELDAARTTYIGPVLQGQSEEARNNKFSVLIKRANVVSKLIELQKNASSQREASLLEPEITRALAQAEEFLKEINQREHLLEGATEDKELSQIVEDYKKFQIPMTPSGNYPIVKSTPIVETGWVQVPAPESLDLGLTKLKEQSTPKAEAKQTQKSNGQKQGTYVHQNTQRIKCW